MLKALVSAPLMVGRRAGHQTERVVIQMYTAETGALTRVLPIRYSAEGGSHLL